MTPIATLIHADEGNQALNLLWQAVAEWRRQGLRVAGLLNPLDAQGKRIRERVCSLTDEREYEIMYADTGDRVADSDGRLACLLNPQELAASSAVIRDALATPPDILVFNKFGYAESEGGGLLDEYAQAVGQGIAVVSLLKTKYLPEWRAFTDGMGTELSDSDSDTLLAWGLGQKGV
ncbi:DUF2478 domain-containing protein [Neisseria perflava]|uniref:DUF2478 domain-containing protein n=1 Tax=Neisseria perflava TaxID=33053 RepID=UPI0020A2178A|nr:DUF2478 domain-containing protein [Neisseria perflava]MCP1660553.1 hypothetical protein [Neisseria perflava]MCP1772703.1 hypothetical protein [Neisseria perflava]